MKKNTAANIPKKTAEPTGAALYGPAHHTVCLTKETAPAEKSALPESLIYNIFYGTKHPVSKGIRRMPGRKAEK